MHDIFAMLLCSIYSLLFFGHFLDVFHPSSFHYVLAFPVISFIIYPEILVLITCLPVVGIYEKFANAFSNAVESMKVGDGFGEGVVQVVSSLFLRLLQTLLTV